MSRAPSEAVINVEIVFFFLHLKEDEKSTKT